VRQALGETNIIAETKKFLIDEGVAVEALEGLRKNEAKILRSTRVILVKNISYATDENEIKNLFGRYGSVTKVFFSARCKQVAGY
jgi:multiple RNA-binding domain-containing protein 1